MKLIISLLLATAAFGQIPLKVINASPGSHLFGGILTTTITAPAAMLVDAPTHKIAYKFFASQTAPIDSCDVNLSVGGSTTGITSKFEIDADSSDAPSGTALGAATAAFSAPAASGWTGLQSLGSNTGTLTLNAPYWLVIYDGGGTAPTGTNYTQARNLGSSQWAGGRIRQFNGTNWTTVTVVTADALFVCHTTTGAYVGFPITSAGAAGSQHIYGTARSGVGFTFGAPTQICGVSLGLSVTGSPSTLDIGLYSGATSIGSISAVPSLSLASTSRNQLWFANPITVPAGIPAYLILHQTSDGGTSGNYYTAYQQFVVNATYSSAVQPSSVYTVTGTSTDPTALTPTTGEVSALAPLLCDASTGLLGVPYGAYVQ